MNPKQTPNYTFALIVVFIVCFLIGFVTTMNNSMIPFCSKAFNLTAQDGQYVNSAFYGAYLLAIPFSFLMSKIGYKGTLVLGLAVVGIGFVINSLGISAAISAGANVYAVFLGTMCLVAMGIVMLQNVANPYVMVLGSPEKGAFRMTLSQALNSVATTVAPIFITQIIISGKTPAPEYVPGPYLGLGIFTLVVCGILVMLKLPKIDEGKQAEDAGEHRQYKSSVFKYPHVWLGALGIFAYMGVEIGVPSMLKYRFELLPEYAGVDVSDVVTSYLSFYWGGMMVGRFVGAGILTKFEPRKLLTSCLLLGAFCILLSLLFSSSMLGIWCMLAAGLFHSVMWPLIFNLGLQELGPHTKAASGVINTGVIGAAILMPLMGAIVDMTGVIIAMCFLFVFYAYIIWFCNWGSKIGISVK
ncbi:MFS transporter [Prevotella sp. P2-180]|uniref:MFS transporter n=1 Tax=Prevotella sp. P2-180 TaxID=2024224 RepID=UPI000B97A6CB|nr:MFS transporter [Prevotella sp. P2-180]MCI6337664.1 MFS transporter [Prevotella sp.]MCI7088311.1 MFS transporter [Prevotella sp.]MCI7256069.1 MFS transporter [Prevotella sp.]MDD5785247.1 MFS transporter [Prevotella sp.]MDD6864072.1 MFS transporter [Prevotella sp.]